MDWEYSKFNEEAVKNFSIENNISKNISRLLLNRGIDTKEKLDTFLNPRIDKLRDPFLFENMDLAVEKVLKIKDEKKTLFIYGDYDVDGITAAAFLTIVFRNIGINAKYHITNRMEEGYGLNKNAIDEIERRNGSLIITVDTGVNSENEIIYARNKGIEIIITDHHKIFEEKKLLKDVVLINPKQSKTYSFKYLAGAGVALKLAEAVYDKLNISKENIYEYFDIVMIGTVADVVPMIDENRVIIKRGLEILKNTKIKGLTYLLKYLKLMNKEISTTDISFYIAPMLNALGRIGTSNIGVEFFLENDDFEIYNIIEEMKKANKTRRNLEREIFTEINDNILKVDKNLNYIFLVSEKWHPGIIGVVSSRLAIKYNLPVFLISLKNGMGKASCRSIEGINIFNILKEISGEFIRFGGHDLAAGFVAKKEKLKYIEEKISEKILEMKTKKDAHILNIDYHLEIDQIDKDFMKSLKDLSPFGLKNTQPIFCDNSVFFIKLKKFGVDNRHFKTFIKKNDKIYPATGFNLGTKIDDTVSPAQMFEIVYYPEKIIYRDEERIQIKIKDFKIKDDFYTIFK